MKLSLSLLLVAALALSLVAEGRAAPRPDSDATTGLPTSPDDLNPPKITVLQNDLRLARGLIFVAPKGPSGPQGPEIVDDQGRPIWFHALTNGDQAADFRVQRYRGEPVLTWTQGQGLGGVPITKTVDYILDRSYRVIATVEAGNGLNADQHEFRITAQNTALIVVYDPVSFDLSPFGGPRTGSVVDGIVQEIDIATGRVLFEWHSLDHVGIAESQAPLPVASAPYDYFHINAVRVDEDGNLLISSRNTWTIYKVDRRTGRVLWRLGGKKSSFALGAGAQFAWQHDPEAVGWNTVRIFDNEAAPTILPRSRVIWLRHDARSGTATLLRSIEHPAGLSAGSQGNSQALDNGDTFVGWGATGRFSEFDSEANLLFDAHVPEGDDTYRAYRHVWRGEPDTVPVATAQGNADATTVHAIWNGATEVERWTVLGGASPGALRPVGSSRWSGLDTAISIQPGQAFVRVIAEGRSGDELGRSEVTAVTP